MHIRLTPPSSLAASAASLALLLGGSAAPVRADSHLPIVDIVPTSSFTLTSDGIDTNGGPKNPPATNGDIELNGTVTLPLLKGLSASYDRQSLSAFSSNLSSFSIGGKTIYPGGSRDLLQNYRLDYHIGPVGIETGFASRYRRCCPADSFEWHKGFLSINYATPPIKQLNKGFFVLTLTGSDAHHYSSPEALANIPKGLSLPTGQLYTTNQAITAVLPVDPSGSLRTATTFLWGAQDFPINGPFPYYYDVFIFSVTKPINPILSLTANAVNVKQREQGSPFPTPFAIRTSSLDLLLDVHVDFNSVMAALRPVPASRPGAPGGPGGPRPPEAPQGSPTPAPATTALQQERAPVSSPASAPTAVPSPAPSPSP